MQWRRSAKDASCPSLFLSPGYGCTGGCQPATRAQRCNPHATNCKAKGFNALAMFATFGTPFRLSDM